MLTRILLRLQSQYLLAASHKLIFLLLPLTLASTLLWLGQPGAQSASAKSALPLATPTPPSVHLVNVPNQALINEDFTFFVTFDNSTAGSTAGFAPFIDLVSDSGGADHNNPPPIGGGPCDGIQLVKAEMVDINGSPIDLTPLSNMAQCNSTPAQLLHPFGGSPFGPVTVPAGGELGTIVLPFGSFQPNQPQVKIKVTAHMSGYADLNYALHIYARGGFRYGQNPLNNPGIDPPILTETNLNSTSWVENQSVTPVVFDIHKKSNAPEDETATGPNFPHRNTITVNVADQQHVDHFVITDHLPGNLQFNGNVHVTIQNNPANPVSACPINPGPYDVVITTPPPSPGGTLTVQLCSTIIGALTADDVVITFGFYIPEKDANGQDILALDCSNSPVKSINDVEAKGDWSPIDPRDTSVLGLISNVTPTDYVLNAKCLALQKSASIIIDTGSPGLTPGDTLQYRLSFQISDYKTIGGLVVQDFLSNGQAFIPGPAVLTISDQFGTKSGPILPAFINQTTDLNGASHFCPPPLQTPPSGTVVSFDIKGAMATIPTFAAPRLNQGIVTGGYAAGSTPPHTAATGLIIFRAQVNDTFQLPVPGDKFVDKDDPINDCVIIMGDVYQNTHRPKIINLPINIPKVKLGSTQDNSATHLLIEPDTLLKTVYAVKRGPNFICGPPGLIGNPPPCSNAANAPQQVFPGDEVTFSLEKRIPSSDAEHLTIEDFLPAPAFNSAGMTFSHTQCIIPNANIACLGPHDQMHVLVGLSWPAFSPLPATNGIKFDYANNIHDSTNTPRTIQLLFTSPVTNQPFADGLYFMNESQECETDSFGDPFCQKAIAQIDVREPSLKITKGVAATSNPHGIFSPALNPANVWQPFGASCPRFQNGPITSTTVGGLTNSDLSNVDASDFVTFAMGVENQGGAPACDIELADILPLDPLDAPSCFGADFSSLCITDGAGNPIPFTTAPGGHGRTIIKLKSGYCLAPGSPTNTTGSNIGIVTFNGQLLDKDHLEAGCCKNKAEVQHYSSVPGGPDFVSAGFTAPFSDDATICSTTLEKSIVATSEVHTTPQIAPSGTPQAAIGEVFRYRLLVYLPESNDPNFEVTDNLPTGMMFLNDGSARLAFISNNGTGITHSGPGLTTAFNVVGTLPLSSSALMNAVFTVPAGIVFGGTGCGSAVNFKLGNVQNNHNDPDIEYVEIEFNALACNIAGNQQPVNQSGTQLSDTFNVSVNSNVIATSNPVDAQIVEPHLEIQKTVTPANPIGTRTFTVSLTNNGQADAFDVHLTDPIPAGFTLVSPAPNVSVSPAACAVPMLTVSGNTLMIDVPKIPAAPTCTVKLIFTVRVDHCDTNTAQVTYTSLPGNAPVGTQANTPGNNTGSSTPCSPLLTSTHEDCERVYNASAQASVNTACTTCAPQPPHMVSWWRLDETSGNIVHDSTSNHYDGTTSSNIGVAPVSAFVPMVNNALNFVFKSMATVPGSPYNFGTGSFSIDAWVQGPVSNANLGIVDKLDTTSLTPTGFAFFVSGGKLTLKLGSSLFQSPSNSFTYNTWQHVAATVQGTGATFVIRFYINGVQSGGPIVTPAVSVNNTQDLLIGFSRLNSGCPSCEVTLDEIEIFDDVLSPADILAIFNSGHTGKCP